MSACVCVCTGTNHVNQDIPFALRAGLLGTLLISGLSYSTRLPECKLYPRDNQPWVHPLLTVTNDKDND